MMSFVFAFQMRNTACPRGEHQAEKIGRGVDGLYEDNPLQEVYIRSKLIVVVEKIFATNHQRRYRESLLFQGTTTKDKERAMKVADRVERNRFRF